MSAASLDEARERHRRGELPGAIDAYSEFLAENPQRADAWHLRALAEHQAGRLEAAWQSVSNAVGAGDAGSPTLLLAGLIARDRGDLAAADDWFARAASSRPGWGPPLANRGQVLMELGRTGEALEVLRAAGAAEPTNARVWNNMALALLKLDRLDEAKRAFEHTLTLTPLATAHFNLARIHNLRNEVPKAMEQANAAVQRDPGLTDAYLLLGDLYRKLRDAEGMRRSYAQAVRANPRSTRARNAYAEFLASVGDAEGAKTAYRHILAEEPGGLRAALGAVLTLPQVYASPGDVGDWRRKFTEGLEGLEASAERFRYPTPREAIDQARWSNFYLAYQGRDDRELQSRYGDLIEGVLRPAFAGLTEARARAPRRDRIRVGFSSHFFFNCTVGRYFSSWITRLDPKRFEAYVYYTNDWIADDTRAVAAAAAVFRHLPGRSFDMVARHILDDQLDALVYPEMGMHVQSFPLGALRLAPVQVAGWGHPVTTGLPQIDYFVSCEAMEPGDSPGH
ncbi:MAG TPA: tetratricopeptide repeat protein, partial [Usitatibacter sp.]|nr:tetratricopeptide repeat protein [Usitatibacter sp.]